MFSRFVALFAVAALVVVATAAQDAPGVPDDCSMQGNYCCDQKFDGPAEFGGNLDDVLAGTGPHAGLTCKPIAVVGADSAPCKKQKVCCAKKNVDGVDKIVCSPVDAGH